jgi:hypothetical protein
MTPALLPPIHGIQAPITDLERLWLETSCYYAVFDDNVMEDVLWDQMAVELWERRLEISPYFAHAVNLPWPVPQGEAGENPLKTAMGVDWTKDLPLVVVEGITKEGNKRLSMWRSRIEKLTRDHQCRMQATTTRTNTAPKRQRRKASPSKGSPISSPPTKASSSRPSKS